MVSILQDLSSDGSYEIHSEVNDGRDVNGDDQFNVAVMLMVTIRLMWQ